MQICRKHVLIVFKSIQCIRKKINKSYAGHTQAMIQNNLSVCMISEEYFDVFFLNLKLVTDSSS